MIQRTQDGKTDRTKPIIVVCGAQWGSEAKGMVAAALCNRYKVDYAVRTGAVNAGHTVYFNGEAYKMQQLPTGWVNPKTKLVLGPGAYINPFILRDEMEMVDKIQPEDHDGALYPNMCDRLYIDPRAGVHDHQHTARSARSGRHHSMGATGKGCSEAVVDRIRLRGTSMRPLWDKGEWAKLLFPVSERYAWFGWYSTDTEQMLNGAYDGGARILLEGTQGQGLDLLLGPWPYTTHKPCSPGQWLVENGLSPKLKTEVVMVARTYPIRVAGNSGPMPNEMNWYDLAKSLNCHLEGKGMPPRVDERALDIWASNCDCVAEEWAEKEMLPRWTDTKKPNARFELWNQYDRSKWAKAVSEFHAEVISRMQKTDPEVVRELMKFFEFTTVTKKLRRIAGWDKEFMKTAVRQIRPDWCVLTFLNYEFPELWGETTMHSKAMEFIRRREKEMGVWIRYVTTGPEEHHMIAVDENCEVRP